MKTLFLFSLFVVGCTQPTPLDRDYDLVPYEGDERGGVYQGRHILGSTADGLASGGWHFAVSGTAVHNGTTLLVTVDGAKLKATGPNGAYDDAQFVGVQFTGPGGELQIVGVELTASGAPRYQLQYRAPGAGWANYCDDATNHAVPFQGRWDMRRYHVGGTDLSFGCIDSGVAAKCVDWGYIPGNIEGTDAWKDNEACAAMANARYCDDGQSHTRELTPIVIRDFVAGAQPDATDPTMQLPVLIPSAATWPPADGFYFETAWPARGPAICLSRLRWSSLPPGGYCEAELPDPRIHGSYPATGIAFCEDFTVAQLQALGARMLNASPVMDIPLQRWQNGTGDRFTTVSGYVEGTHQFAPAAGYTLVGSDAILLRTLTDGLDPMTDVVEVFRQHTAGDQVIAPRRPDSTGVTSLHVVDEREGYLLTSPGPGRSPFKLWVHDNGVDYVSGTDHPGTGYNYVRTLGYAISPP